jgi:hypothetical protein
MALSFDKYTTNGAMSKAQEAQFNRDAEKHFKSHPELPNGRDFRFNSEFDPEADSKYRNNFDRIFPNSPGLGI